MTWQPIETAPKDGTPVFVGWDNGLFDGAVAHYENGSFGVLLPFGGFHIFTNQPTHWITSPEPPQNPNKR